MRGIWSNDLSLTGSSTGITVPSRQVIVLSSCPGQPIGIGANETVEQFTAGLGLYELRQQRDSARPRSRGHSVLAGLVDQHGIGLLDRIELRIPCVRRIPRLRILQPRHALMGTIPDDQRHALFGGRGRHEKQGEQSGGENGPTHRQVRGWAAPDLAETCPEIDHGAIR